MKKLVVASILLISTGALADPSNNPTFEQDMKATASALVNTDEDCTFKVSSIATGLELTLKGTNGNTISLVVPPFSEVFPKATKNGSTVYSISSGYQITVTHADDAYDSISILNRKDNQSASCEIDY